jgi:TRAP-type C4-dicarboxylate transport system permease small subunit
MTEAEKTAPQAAPRLVRGLEASVGCLAAAMLFAMMALTFVDVLGRYLFRAPVQGAYDLVALAMGIVVFAGLPVVTVRGEHLQIGLFENLIRGTARRVLSLLIDLVSVVVLSVYAWRIFLHARHLLRSGEVMVSLAVSVAPFALFMSAMSAASAAIVLALVVGRMRLLLHS